MPSSHPALRRCVVAVIGVLLALGATACSGDEPDDDPTEAPSIGGDATGASATEEPTTSADDEQQLEDVLAGYQRALAAFLTSDGKTSDFDGVATDALAAEVTGTFRDNAFDNGFVFIGTFTFTPIDIAVDGDVATLSVCEDGRQVVPVEQGGTADGATGGLRRITTFGAERDGEGWLLSAKEPTTEEAC